jgi:hypothetical protein
MKMSISFVTKTNMTSLKHNNRELTEAEYQEPAHKHIQQDRSSENIYIKKGNLKETYDELFGEALEKYNAKQKRADRKITDYYQHVKKSKTLDLQREIVVTVGKKEDWENLSLDDKKAVAGQLEAYINEFEQRHAHLHIYNAVIHMDEAGAPHAHFNIVPVADGYKKGLEKQPSFKKALQNEGYKEKGRGQLKEFRDKEILCLEEKLQSLGIERQKVGTNDIKDMREYKQLVGELTKVEQDLLAEYGAPEYINDNGKEFVSEEFWREAQNWAQIFNTKSTVRQTTPKEKLNWIKEHLEQLKKEAQNSKSELTEIDKNIKEKSDTLSKIDSKLSDTSSKLSELLDDINNRSDDLTVLKRDLETSRRQMQINQDYLARDRRIAENWRKEITGELKKTAFGKEYIRMDPETYEKARMSNHWFQVKQDKLEQEIGQLRRDLDISNQARFKLIDENEDLKVENKWLFEDNKALFKRLEATNKKLQVWRHKTRKLLSKKEFKAITKAANAEFLKSLSPVVKVAETVVKTIKKMTL